MPTKPPNMVIFMPDEQRWDCVGYTGNDVIQTPNIDRLAAEGTGFNHFYVNHTVCSPSRVCMFTGWYPHVRGHRTLWYLLQPDEPNVFRYLKEAGYHVEMWGKNHLLADASVESSISFRGTIDYDRERGINNNPIDPNDKWFRTMYYGERPADNSNDWDRQWVDGALEFLNSNPPEPFCPTRLTGSKSPTSRCTTASPSRRRARPSTPANRSTIQQSTIRETSTSSPRKSCARLWPPTTAWSPESSISSAKWLTH